MLDEHSIKDIERLLGSELRNWLRWANSKDYLPKSFGSILGQLYVPMRGDLQARLYKPVPVDILGAVAFEAIVVTLPEKHRKAFVMYHLGRAVVKDRIVTKKRNGYEIARILGVHRSRYYVLLREAHNMIFRRFGRPMPNFAEPNQDSQGSAKNFILKGVDKPEQF